MTSSRLLLMPLTSEHRDDLYSIYREPEISRFLLSNPRDDSGFDRIFQLALGYGASRGMRANFGAQGRSVIGRVGFFEYSEARGPELACLLSRRVWGEGLGTEACRTALAWTFGRHPWSEVVALVHSENQRAARECVRLGMHLKCDTEVGSLPAPSMEPQGRRLTWRPSEPVTFPLV